MLNQWSAALANTYASNAASQFILHGNVNDQFLLPAEAIGTLSDYLFEALMQRFDVLLSYDIGNGIQIRKGGEILSTWPHFKKNSVLPSAPRAAVEFLTHYFRYANNLAQLGQKRLQIGLVIRASQLLAPAVPDSTSYDLNSLALQIRDWADDSSISGLPLATFLLTENLNELHQLITANSHAQKLKIPLPSSDEVLAILEASRSYLSHRSVPLSTEASRAGW